MSGSCFATAINLTLSRSMTTPPKLLAPLTRRFPSLNARYTRPHSARSSNACLCCSSVASKRGSVNLANGNSLVAEAPLSGPTSPPPTLPPAEVFASPSPRLQLPRAPCPFVRYFCAEVHFEDVQGSTTRTAQYPASAAPTQQPTPLL